MSCARSPLAATVQGSPSQLSRRSTSSVAQASAKRVRCRRQWAAPHLGQAPAPNTFLLFKKKQKHLATLRYLQPTHSKYLQITVGSSRTLAILCSDAFSEDRDTAHTQFVKRRWRKFRDPCPTPCLKDGSRYSKPVPLFSLSKPLYESLSGWYLPRAVLEHSRHPMLPFEGFFAKHIRVLAKVGTCFARRGGGHIMPKEVPRV